MRIRRGNLQFLVQVSDTITHTSLTATNTSDFDRLLLFTILLLSLMVMITNQWRVTPHLTAILGSAEDTEFAKKSVDQAPTVVVEHPFS